jgi:peroxiredoxin/uncharacterized membrane protein YphA (DoxX/SURF4 family)
MDVTLLVARLFLAAVFLLAGLTKFAGYRGFRAAVADFGVPKSLTVPATVAVPIVEVLVAVGLVMPGWARTSAAAALALLLAFSAAITINLARGRQPECRCFGQLQSGPINSRTLVRNGVLVGLAAIVVWRGPGQGLRGGGDSLTLESAVVLAVIIALLAVVAAQGWLLINLLRQNGRVLLRLDAIEADLGLDPAAEPAAGLPVGSHAPELALLDSAGQLTTVASLRDAAPVLMVVFTAPGCGPCHGLLPQLADWQRQHAGRLSMTVINHGSTDQAKAIATEHDLSGVLADPNGSIAQAYRAQGTPSAVFIDHDGRIASPLAGGVPAIRRLIFNVLHPSLPVVPRRGSQPHGRRGSPPVLRTGDPVPEITLMDLEGRQQSLQQFFSHPTVLLFWNPACGFCQNMTPALQAWQAHARKTTPRLVIISTGTVKANRALGFQAPILLDPHRITADRFGARGTPNAILVNKQGIVASKLAAGADQVLKLGRTRRKWPAQLHT